MIFPLKLVPFEDYLLTDDRANYPMNFFLRLEFRGTLERQAFQTALETALARHPLLGAVVRRSRNGRLEWESAESLRPQLRWDTDSDRGTYLRFSPIDLQNEVGLRVYVNEREGQTVAWFQFHHVCCDGLGAMRFLEDLLVSYHAGVCGSNPIDRLRPIDPQRLCTRGKFGRTAAERLLQSFRELLGLVGYGLLGTFEYFAHRPLVLPSRGGDWADGASCRDSSPDKLLATCEHSFTNAETARLRKTAKSMSCTTNDLLLRDLFLALGDWVAQHEPNKRPRYLRIMIPTSLRGANDFRMPAANRVSMIFLDRRPYKLPSPRDLLESVRRDMRAVKSYDLGLALLYGIRIARRLPGGLKKMLPEDRCLATALFTNLLDPTLRFPLPRRHGRIVVGDLTLERLEAFAPLRPKTHASFAAMIYAGRLSISLSYDPRHFGAECGQELLDTYVQHLRASLNGTV